MPHHVFYSLNSPLSSTPKHVIQQNLEILRSEMENASRGLWSPESLEERMDRLEAFALLSEQHAANMLMAMRD
tara:strand:- start:31642 stop:31860 length:219 start_codon:yes stop_codon:yes gene_type:complete